MGAPGEFYWTSHGEHTESPVGVYAMGGGTEVLKTDDALAIVDDFVAEKLGL